MLAIAGTDLNNFIKQAAEFRLVESGQKLASFISYVNDVHGLGLQTTQGLLLAESLLLGPERRHARLFQADSRTS